MHNFLLKLELRYHKIIEQCYVVIKMHLFTLSMSHRKKYVIFRLSIMSAFSVNSDTMNNAMQLVRLYHNLLENLFGQNKHKVVG